MYEQTVESEFIYLILIWAYNWKEHLIFCDLNF